MLMLKGVQLLSMSISEMIENINSISDSYQYLQCLCMHYGRSINFYMYRDCWEVGGLIAPEYEQKGKVIAKVLSTHPWNNNKSNNQRSRRT
jgi:hypothetical protein